VTAYVIAIINVTDPEGYEVYKEMAPPAIAKYGGRYIARGGRSEVLEGDPEAERFVILEFESYEKAREWWNSPEYEAAKVHRRASAISQLMLVEGLS
jgi:uncharacterized protein (DUF1330 family)